MKCNPQLYKTVGTFLCMSVLVYLVMVEVISVCAMVGVCVCVCVYLCVSPNKKLVIIVPVPCGPSKYDRYAGPIVNPWKTELYSIHKFVCVFV